MYLDAGWLESPSPEKMEKAVGSPSEWFVARQGDGAAVGRITSAVGLPGTERPIALGFLNRRTRLLAFIAPVLAVTNRDERCAMVDVDPDSGRRAPELFKAVVRERDNQAGVYGTVLRRGRLRVGQPVLFTPVTDRPVADAAP